MTIPSSSEWRSINFSTVVFRHCPRALRGAILDQHNARLLEKVIAGRKSICRTRGCEEYALRIAIAISTRLRRTLNGRWRRKRAAGSGTRA